MILKIVLFLLLLASPAMGATLYVRSGGSGGCTTSWSNACGQLTTAISAASRGDTIFVATGSYTTPTFDKAASGSLTITIKKAVPTGTVTADYPSGMTAAQAHGTDTGWNSSYGEGQATIGGTLTFVSGYWVLDGQKRNESDWSSLSAYGFSIAGVYENSFNTAVGDNITLRHMNIGPDDGTSNQEGYGGAVIYIGGFTDIAQNWTVERNYIHNGRTMVQHAGVHNMLYQYNLFAKNWEKTGIRHQIRGSSVVIRYNIFKNTCQGNYEYDPGSGGCTAIIGWYGNAGSNNEDYSYSKVYGNVFWDSIKTKTYSDACIFMGDDRTSQGGGPQNCTGCAAYNNTFVGMAYGVCTLSFLGIKTASEARNNIWYDVQASTGCTAATCSNNYVVGNVFVNTSVGNFHLTSDGVAGTGHTLSSPYNIDMDGTTRGWSGVWDVGAYEYPPGGGDTTAPVITITSPTSNPTYTTPSPSITLQGTASDAVGVTSVTYNNAQGGSGSCTGTTSWTCSSIVLNFGSNAITVTAYDAATNSGTDVITVTFAATVQGLTISSGGKMQ